eukprot:TRINITY_DN16151_c0_g2_i2.p1 TRINITY_DN16151_c0_g2~~TRINITY_DN16151_c0_g2_i2.p1  ORF type:complete len:898 (-),score=148.57 TRINITY_DN16151_c0_g2_i2:13-2706(-)
MSQTGRGCQSVSYYGEEASARGAVPWGSGGHKSRSLSATWPRQSRLSRRVTPSGRIFRRSESGQEIQKIRRKDGDDLSSRRRTSRLSLESEDSIMDLQLPELHSSDKEVDVGFLLATLEELRNEVVDKIQGNLASWFRREFRSYTAEMLQLQKELSRDLKRDMSTETSRIGQKLVIDLEEALTHHFRSREVDKSVLDQARVNMCKEVAEASSLEVIGDFKESLVDDVAHAVRQEFSGIFVQKLEANTKLVVQELKDMKVKFSTEDLCAGQQGIKQRPRRSTTSLSKKTNSLTVCETAELNESPSAKLLLKGNKTDNAPISIEDVTGTLFERPSVVEGKAAFEVTGQAMVSLPVHKPLAGTCGVGGNVVRDAPQRRKDSPCRSSFPQDPTSRVGETHQGALPVSPMDPTATLLLGCRAHPTTFSCDSPTVRSDGAGANAMTPMSSMGFLERQAQKKAERDEQKEQEPWWALFVKSDRFEQITAMVVITSTIILGLQTNAAAKYPKKDEAVGYKILDVLFAIFFTSEVVVRMIVHGRIGFFYGSGRKWNRFDFLIIVFTNLDLLLKLTINGTEFYTVLESLGFLRLMRLGKLLRVLRMVGLIPELKMMVYLISASFHSFIWALILMMLMIFVVSVYFTEVVAKMVRDDILAQDEVSPMWGTIGSSVLSLFQAISGGDDWSVFMEPLGADPTFMGSTNIMFFSFYVAFMIFVTMNLVTGVFVEGAQRLISEDKDAEFLKKTQALFGISDTDGNLEISYSEFQELIAADEINEYFISCDFNRNAASGLFQLLDADQSGSLSLDEFVGGCLRLRSVARCVDLVNLCIVISEGERVRDRQFCKLSLEQTAMRREIMRIAEMLEAICEAAGTVVPPPCQTVSEPSGAQVHGCVSRGTWLMDRKL